MEIEEAKRRARSGPALLMLRRAFSILITFLSTVTIARLVSPRDFGLATMATVLLSLGQMFRDFGLTNAVLRKGFVSEEEMTLIFWFNCAMTVMVAVVIAIMAPFAADFYKEPIVKWVILVSLIGFTCGGLALQHRALLQRELRFGAITVIESGSQLIGFLVSLGLALAWRDVWAIVLGTLAQSMSASIISIMYSGWRPGRPRRSDEMGSLLKFGANTSVYSLGTFISQNAAAVFIGHFLGSSQLGQYNRAQALFQMPTVNLIQPLTQAMMPLLTRLRSHDEEYRGAYLDLVRKMCAFLMPASVALTFCAVPLVTALLGARWYEAGMVLAVLAPTLAAVGYGYSVSDLFITQDRSAELRTLGAYDVLFRVGGVAAGIYFGLVGAAIGFSVATVAVIALRIHVSGRAGPVSTRDQWSAGIPGLFMALGTLAACFLVSIVTRNIPFGDAAQAAMLLSGGVAGALVVGILNATCRKVIIELAETFGLGKGYRLVMRYRKPR